MTKDEPRLLLQFKALAHANRLKIIGLLAQTDYTVEELASLLQLTAPTVSHHLSILASADLVHASAQGYYSVYSLDSATLSEIGEWFRDDETRSEFGEGIDRAAYQNDVVRTFLATPLSQRMLPKPARKRAVILDYITSTFQRGTKHTHPQVQESLAAYLPATDSLLDELLSTGRMTYHDKGYWVGHVDHSPASGLGIWD
jgi:DNA-binding transcriptional ArsR family regulator